MPYGAGIEVSRSGHNLISINRKINRAVFDNGFCLIYILFWLKFFFSIHYFYTLSHSYISVGLTERSKLVAKNPRVDHYFYLHIHDIIMH